MTNALRTSRSMRRAIAVMLAFVLILVGQGVVFAAVHVAAYTAEVVATHPEHDVAPAIGASIRHDHSAHHAGASALPCVPDGSSPMAANGLLDCCALNCGMAPFGIAASALIALPELDLRPSSPVALVPDAVAGDGPFRPPRI